MSLTLGARASLRTVTVDGATKYLRHTRGRGAVSTITDESSELEKLDATWQLSDPLIGGQSAGGGPLRISLESVNFPGGFLRHKNGVIFQAANDGTEQFAFDATFVVVPAESGSGFSLAALNFPNSYLRHYTGELYLAAFDGTEPYESPYSWDEDVTWFTDRAWA